MSLTMIQKPEGNFDDINLQLVLSGHLGESGEVIQSNVHTVIRLGIDEIGNIFDQLLSIGDSPAESVDVSIGGRNYILDRDMALSLMLNVERVWFDHEHGETAGDFLPEEEWTEAYLLSL